jgi:AcrR family transcriptional regulator
MMDTNDPEKPDRRERRRARTREQLKTAALELVLEKGYDQLSIQDITDRADLGRGTFYIYFNDKQDIVWKIIADGIQDAAQSAARQFADNQPPQIEYYGYLNTFRHAQQNRDLYRVMLGSQGSAAISTQALNYMAEDTLQDMDKMTIYTDFDLPKEITVQLVVGAMFRVLIWWLETPNSYTPEDMAAMVYQGLHHHQPPEGFPGITVQ